MSPHRQPAPAPAFATRVHTARLSRRAFVHTSLSLAAAGTLRGAPSPVLRAAVIGHTGRGDYGHGLGLIFQGRPDIELVAVADPVESGRLRMARDAGAARSYADWRELLERERPDLVSIAPRHADQHAEIALGCLQSGAHCYLEKPMVRTCQEADAVLSEAARQSRRVAVAHTMRMSPAVRRLRELVADGRIGDLREMQAWGKQDARAGGEDLMVLGTHLMDLMRLFAGDPRWLSARITTQGRDITVADRRRVRDEVGWVAGDTVRAQIAFDRGIQGQFTSDGALRDTTGHWGLELRGSRGLARLRCDLVPSAFLRTGPSWTATGHPEVWEPLEGVAAMVPDDHHRASVSDWLEAIRADREPECSGRNGAWAIEMVAAAYQSALGGVRVTFPLTDRRGPLDP